MVSALDIQLSADCPSSLLPILRHRACVWLFDSVKLLNITTKIL